MWHFSKGEYFLACEEGIGYEDGSLKIFLDQGLAVKTMVLLAAPKGEAIRAEGWIKVRTTLVLSGGIVFAVWVIPNR